MRYDKELIRNRLSIKDVLELNGVQVTGSRIPCPIHNGRNKNFKLTEHGFTCFVCGEKGDIFDLHAKLNNISFAESIAELARVTGLEDSGSKEVRTASRNIRLEKKLDISLKEYNRMITDTISEACSELDAVSRELPELKWDRLSKIRDNLEVWLDRYLLREDKTVTLDTLTHSIMSRGLWTTVFDTSLEIPEPEVIV